MIVDWMTVAGSGKGRPAVVLPLWWDKSGGSYYLSRVCRIRQSLQPGYLVKIGVKADDGRDLPLSTGECNQGVVEIQFAR